MDKETLTQFQEIIRILRKRIYNIRMPQVVIQDLDFTLLAAYGRQKVRKAGHLTSIIRVMATIRSFVMTESQVI